jgi:hypothetical protein
MSMTVAFWLMSYITSYLKKVLEDPLPQSSSPALDVIEIS